MKLKTVNDILVTKANSQLIRFFGKRWKVVLINEFPKCGASWLRRMLSEYQGVELSNGNNNRHGWLGLVGKDAILQRHWINRGFNVDKTILAVRDPRDVYNSFYFHETYFHPRARFLNEYGYVEEDDDKSNLFRYLKHKFAHPGKSIPHFLYSDWWDSYRSDNSSCTVKYEDLVADAESEMTKLLHHLGIQSIDTEKLREVIDNNRFEKVNKRKKGQEDKTSHARKGVVGDWRNNFSSETIALVKEHLNDLILDLKYEETPNWS